MEMKLTRQAAYNINDHFVWLPKYRRKVLVGEIAVRLSELLHQKTKQLDGEILNLTVQPDPVHLFFPSHDCSLSDHVSAERLHGARAEKRVSRTEQPLAQPVDTILLCGYSRSCIGADNPRLSGRAKTKLTDDEDLSLSPGSERSTTGHAR